MQDILIVAHMGNKTIRFRRSNLQTSGANGGKGGDTGRLNLQPVWASRFRVTFSGRLMFNHYVAQGRVAKILSNSHILLQNVKSLKPHNIIPDLEPLTAKS